MDVTTLNRIKRNKPDFMINPDFNSELISQIDNLTSELKRFIPDASWFLVPEEINICKFIIVTSTSSFSE